MLVGIEGGGTHFVVSVSSIEQPNNVIDYISYPTTTPSETLNKAIEYIKTKENIKSIGYASFGPIDLKYDSKTYGYITATPKLLWKNVDVLSPFKVFNLPIGFNTDVNAAALAELSYGGHGNISNICYITVGTGVGVGIVANNQCISGLMHPEGGHFRVPKHPEDTYEGNCPYHKDCLEGLSNAKAVADRCGIDPSLLSTIPDDHPVWKFQIHYMAELCATITFLISPEVIVLAGGVNKRTCLLPEIRKRTLQILNGYIQVEKILSDIDKYIVYSKYEMAGTIGALELARLANNSN